MNRGIVINQDADGFVGSCGGGTCTVKDIEDFARQYGGTQVTDFMICINNTNSSYPSKVMTSLLDKYHQKEENGEPVDYSDHYMTKGAHHIYETLGTDYIKILIDTMREVGIRPWLSIRMNDAHGHGAERSVLLSEFYHNHKECRRAGYRENPDIHDKVWDYGKETVREYYKAFITEAVERYDADGIEIDFMRDFYYFAPGSEMEGLDILNDFMREIDAIRKAAEKRYGHSVKIAVRVPVSIDYCYDYSFDIMTWVSEKLVDVVCPAPYFSTTYSELPVFEWKRVLAPYDVELWPVVECNTKASDVPEHSNARHTDLATIYGYTNSFLSQGADKVYYFNYYYGVFSRFGDLEPDVYTEDRPIDLTGYKTVLMTAGDPDMVKNLRRRHILTYCDMSMQGKKRGDILPLTFKVHWYFKIYVGDIPEDAEVIIKLAADDKGIDVVPDVHVGGLKCEYLGTEPGCTYTPHEKHCWRVPKEAHSKLLRPDVEIKGAPITVVYLEAEVKPAK